MFISFQEVDTSVEKIKMIWIPLQIILSFYCNSCLAWRDSFADLASLMNITQEISKMFKYSNYPKSESVKAAIMENMITKVAIYDVPSPNFDNWEKIFLANTEDLQISMKNPDLIKYTLNNMMTQINKKYNHYKLYASQLRGQSNGGNITHIQPASHDFQRIMSPVNWTDNNDLYLQKIAINIQWLQYYKCEYEMQPMQNVIFESCISLISMQLKAFMIDVFFYTYQFANDKMINDTLRNEIIDRTLVIVNDNLNKYYTVMKHGLIVSSKKIEMCDQKPLKQGENYLELTRICSKSADSDARRDMIVTGVKFIKINNTIYTQIKQGQLVPGGRTINNKWKSIEKSDSEIINVNYSKENITFDLNDLRCPSVNYVLTGVGLRKSKFKANADRIVPFIECHQVDFTGGLVLPGTATDPRENMQEHVNELKIGGQRPNDTRDIDYPDSVDDEFLKIKMSVNKSVIPWLDAQSVTSGSNVPLYGVGLYHRGSSNSGGFLAYRLISIDFTRFIFSDVSQKELAHVKRQRELEKAPPAHYCSRNLAETICVICNGSYNSPYHQQKRQYRTEFVGSRHRRSIINDCCINTCSAKYLKQYCGKPRVNISNLNC